MPLCHFGALSISASFPLFYAAHEPILTEPDGLDYRRHSVVRWQLPVAGEQQQVGVGIVVYVDGPEQIRSRAVVTLSILCLPILQMRVFKCGGDDLLAKFEADVCTCVSCIGLVGQHTHYIRDGEVPLLRLFVPETLRRIFFDT